MGLIEALRANAEFVAGGPPSGKTGAGATLVIADSSPELAGILDEALGLTRGRAVVVRLAGAWGGREGQELLRSVAMGLHVHNCSEILVVGSDAGAGQPDRRALRGILSQRGLDPDGAQIEQLLDLTRGPANPSEGVRDTVRLLRASPLVPEGTPVHGCLLQSESGLLKVIDQDPAIASRSKQREARKTRKAEDPLDFELPELPEIPLPEIPALDLDDLTNPPPPPAKKTSSASDYGAKGSGPVSMADMQKMPDAQMMAAPADAGAGWVAFETIAQVDEPHMSVAPVEFQVPEAATIQDTGLGDASAMRPGQPKVEQERFAQGLQAMSSVQPMPDVREDQILPEPPRRPKPKPAPARRPERPEVTPIIRQAQPPQGERVIEFGQAEPPRLQPKQEQQPRGPRVDIKAGYVAKDGAEFPLDPELQRALLKVARFLTSEFAVVDRKQIVGRIRKAAHQNQQTGELLKLMIGPVLKLGKKRYAVINELLKIKEELPRQAPDVAVALLEEILTGNQG